MCAVVCRAGQCSKESRAEYTGPSGPTSKLLSKRHRIWSTDKICLAPSGGALGSVPRRPDKEVGAAATGDAPSKLRGGKECGLLALPVLGVLLRPKVRKHLGCLGQEARQVLPLAAAKDGRRVNLCPAVEDRQPPCDHLVQEIVVRLLDLVVAEVGRGQELSPHRRLAAKARKVPASTVAAERERRVHARKAAAERPPHRSWLHLCRPRVQEHSRRDCHRALTKASTERTPRKVRLQVERVVKPSHLESDDESR